MSSNKKDFLYKLQTQAKKQAVLNDKSVLPKQVEGLAAVIANYSWQVILVLSILSAITLELFKNF